MAALNTATDKLVGVSGSGSLSAPKKIDIRVFLMRILKDAGLEEIVLQNTPPSNKRVLWWHKEIKTLKRYDPIALSWLALTPNQWALHLAQIGLRASGAETILGTGDLVPFMDVSADEMRVITRENLIAQMTGQVPQFINQSPTETIINILDPFEEERVYRFTCALTRTSAAGAYRTGDVLNPSVDLRVRTAGNSNIGLRWWENAGSGGIVAKTGTVVTPWLPMSTDDTTTAIPFQMLITRYADPHRVSLVMGSEGQLAINRVESISGSVAAKIHFTTPTGFAMRKPKLFAE